MFTKVFERLETKNRMSYVPGCALLFLSKGFTKARRQQQRFFVRGGYTPRGSSRTFAGGGSPKAAQQQLVGGGGVVGGPYLTSCLLIHAKCIKQS